jgi:pyruvate,water dikinase
MEIENRICPLTSLEAINISEFGAKGANLAKAVQLGFAVPDAMVISRTFPPEQLTVVAHDIIYKLSAPIAVRSSSTIEDSENKAFAGQFETQLGIQNSAELVKAYSLVKMSGNSSHIKKYNGEFVPPEQIAVVVQHMINATRAGVAFSRDPVTGEPKVIIDSSYGLGKSVVDGDVTPDSIEFIDDDNFNVYVGRKSTKINLSRQGIQKVSTSLEDTKRCSLSKFEIRQVACLARSVELKFGFPADIEWAFDSSGLLWLLQARPITTIK